MIGCRGFIVAVLLATGLPTQVIAQSWHQWRGDASRSATFEDPLDIETPGIRWKSRAGGLLTNDYIWDVDGDGRDDVLTIEGGRVVARGVTGNLLWDTPNVLATRIEGAFDLNGDGERELLLRRTASFAVLQLATGALIWESQLDVPMESLSSFHVTDLEGDGGKEVLIADQAMNAGKPYLTGQVHVYSFLDGFDNAFPRVSTELDTRDYEVGRSVTSADLDGDGVEEIIVTGKRAVYVYSGSTGELITGSNPDAFSQETFLGMAELFVRDLDGDSRPEVIVMVNANFVGESTREAIVLETTDTGELQVRWRRPISNTASGTHRWSETPFLLGNDGGVNLITSEFAPGAGWTTQLLDAQTGDVEEELPGVLCLAVVEWTEGQKSLLMTPSSSQQPGDYKAHQVFSREDGEWSVSKSFTGWVVLGDSPEPGRFLLVVDDTGDGWGNAIEKRSFPDIGLEQRIDVEVLAFRTGQSDGLPALFTVEPLGRVGVRTQMDLLALNDQDGDGLPDLRLGGYSIGRVVADGPLVVHAQAGGRLVVVDGATGSPTEEPTVVTSVTGSLNQQPVIFRSDAGLSLAVMTRNEVSRVLQVRAHDLSGAELWTSTLGGTGGVYGINREIMVADLNGDGVDDLVLLIADSIQSSLHRVFAVDGAKGVALWQPRLIETPGGSVGQLSYDEALNVILLTGNKDLYEWDGQTGVLIRKTTNTANHYYGRPVVVDLESDGVEETVLVGSSKGALAFNADRSERWSLDMGSATRATGVVGVSEGSVVFGLAKYQSPEFWIVNATGEVVGQHVLAYGQVYPSLDEAPEEASKAFLVQASFASDLDGEGTPAFLLTSTDGFIYGLGLDGELVWSLDVEGATGAPALFDADGDGVGELLIPSQSGEVVALDQTTLTAPEWIHEIAELGTTEDKDTQENCDSLILAWAPVVGATGYRIAVYSENGTFLSLHAIDGPVSEAVISDLSLVVNAGYFVRISATYTDINGTVSGPFQESDGITVIDEADPFVSFFTVSPYALVPAQGTSVVTLAAEGGDTKGIASYTLEILGPFEDTWTIWSGDVNASDFAIEVVWDGRDDSGDFPPGGLQTARLTLVDLAGKTVVEERELFLCTSPNIYDPLKEICYPAPVDQEPESEEPVVSSGLESEGPVLTVGGETEGTPISLPYAPSGCSCQVTGEDSNRVGALAGIGLVWMVLVGMRRRAIRRLEQ